MQDPTAPSNFEPNEVGFSDVLITLGEQKKLIIAVTVIGICASAAVAMLLPKTYTANTLLLSPQQQSGGAAAALAQLGDLGGMAGLAGGVKTPTDMYVALLESRSVQDAMIAKFGLQSHYETETLQDTRKELDKRVVVSSDKKTGLIKLNVDDEDAAFSAKLANAHVDELRNLLARLALTDAQQQRQYLETQVKKTQSALNAAEIRFRQAQSASGMVVTQALAESGVRESAALRAQIAAREVQLQTLMRFATSAHPDVQRVSAELGALRRQLMTLEQGTGVAGSNTATGAEAVQAFRDMKVQEAMLEALIRQLEMVRADEAREGPLLQQVDAALPPELPTKPKRSLIVAVGSVLGFMSGLVLAAIINSRRKNKDAWQRVKQAWL